MRKDIKIKDIELANISRYRSELMGAAMLFVILFHVGLPREDIFFGLRRMGNIGVDIFLFLSGMGLWFSWTRNPSLHRFYLRRFLRIYPAWLLMASLYYIPDYLSAGFAGHSGHSTSLIDLIGDITVNWDFWLHDELTFWYIPAILFLYAVSPFYMSLVIRHPIYRWLPVAMIMWCILVQYVTPVHEAVGHLEIFWSRVPIFFIGINMAAAVKRKETMDGASIWMIGLMFVMALASSIFLEQVKHGQFPLFLERMLYIPLTDLPPAARHREQSLPSCRHIKPGGVSHPRPLRTGVCRAQRLVLLAYIPRDDPCHHFPGVDAARLA